MASNPLPANVLLVAEEHRGQVVLHRGRVVYDPEKLGEQEESGHTGN